MPTVAYLRCSTDQQDTLRQREAIERCGVKIHQWLEDHESRDRADKRPDFQRLLRAVQAGQVDTIVVQTLDRFGVKDAYEMGKFFSILRDHDCRLVDAAGKQLNADDDATVLTSTIGALTSSREQREKATRVLTGKMTLASKGNFLGGYCPFGMDVVAFDAQGNEVWRVVYEGHDRRRKIYPDGREERFDGKKNRPPKALHETLKYRPSIIAERVKYVRLIFKWFITEAITAGQIASRLNDLGVSPVFGPLWHQGVVKYLLANPIYVGKPTYNKQSNGRFMEFSNGQVKTAERKPARKHHESDHIRPERDEFKPMVDPEVFDRAQTKLAATKTRAYKAPKTAPLWLRGFVVCAKCGKPMRGLSGNPGNGLQPGYLCAEYSRWSKRSPSGCGHYRVDHDLLESLILDYLTQTAPQVKAILDATTATDMEAARPLLDAIQSAKTAFRDIWYDMLSVVADHEVATDEPHDGDIPTVYGRLFERARPGLEKQIAEKEAELEALLDGYKDLSPKLRERANKRGEALQEEIDALNQQLRDLRIPWDQFRQELSARQDALAKATTTLNLEGRHRQKAEVLRAVVDKIICHFTGSGRRVRLESIEVIPAEDAAVRPLTFPGSLLKDSCLATAALVLPSTRPQPPLRA
jgi:DNA invertase Pin-like site-specific DNA recombinase